MKRKSVYAPRVPLFQAFEYSKNENPMYYLNYYMMFAAVEHSNGLSCFCFEISKQTGSVRVVNLPVSDCVYKVEINKNKIISFILNGRHDFWVTGRYKEFGHDDRPEIEEF